jgi:hypothetical protein
VANKLYKRKINTRPIKTSKATLLNICADFKVHYQSRRLPNF